MSLGQIGFSCSHLYQMFFKAITDLLIGCIKCGKWNVVQKDTSLPQTYMNDLCPIFTGKPPDTWHSILTVKIGSSHHSCWAPCSASRSQSDSATVVFRTWQLPRINVRQHRAHSASDKKEVFDINSHVLGTVASLTKQKIQSYLSIDGSKFDIVKSSFATRDLDWKKW